MKQADESFTVKEINVSEIIFNSLNPNNTQCELCLLGSIDYLGERCSTEFIIQRSDFETLCRGKYGIEILNHIEKTLLQPHGAPLQINLIQMFGAPIKFKAKEIELNVSFNEDENGTLRPVENVSVLFIESIII